MRVYWEPNMENREHWFDIPDADLIGLTEEEICDLAQEEVDIEFNNNFCGIVTRLER